MPEILSVGEAARELNCFPKQLTDWFYLGYLDSKRCPIVAGRRQIPRSYLPAIRAALQKRPRRWLPTIVVPSEV